MLCARQLNCGVWRLRRRPDGGAWLWAWLWAEWLHDCGRGVGQGGGHGGGRVVGMIVGMVGGGQLARMTHQAAISLGIGFRVLAADVADSAALVAPHVDIGVPDDL